MESLMMRDVRSIDERLDGRFVYSQVPAFAACDRAMLDVLTCTVDGRLAILELKANEDMHLPLQGLDYWARVHWHQKNGEFTSNGYFAGRELSSAPPLLFLVAPALRTHPTTDVLLRYLSPRIEWTLVQVDEHWRHGVRVVNRKHPGKTCNCGFRGGRGYFWVGSENDCQNRCTLNLKHFAITDAIIRAFLRRL